MRIRTNSTGHAIAIALRAAYMALHRRTDAAFVADGVTADQFVLLANLSEGHALTQRELARRMSSDPSTVRAMLVLLERDRFVKRDTHPTDARARTVAITHHGMQAFQKLWSSSEAVRVQMLSTLQSDEGETLVRLLGRLAEVLNRDTEMAEASCPSLSPEDRV